LLSLFHFALRPNGYMLLGLSESADGITQLYTSVDKKHRIYMRRSVPRYVQPIPTAQRFPGGLGREHLPALHAPTASDRGLVPIDVHQNILERYAPPSVIVDENYDIVHLSSHAGR